MAMPDGYLPASLKSFKSRTMDIQPFIELDKILLLQWNGSDSLFWDGFMWVSTSTFIWIPLGIVLLYVIIRNNSPKEAFITLLAIALVITLADQISSGICKPLFARFRPTQDPEIMYLVDTVNGYKGGRYGFISSHAANTFAMAVFVSLLTKSPPFMGNLECIFSHLFRSSLSGRYLIRHNCRMLGWMGYLSDLQTIKRS